MTQEVINVGLVPNDQTGDVLRDAFIKINENFDEVYIHMGASSAHNVVGDVVGTESVQTLKNKKLESTTVVFSDPTEPTKIFRLDTSLISVDSVSVISVPDKDGTFALLDDVPNVNDGKLTLGVSGSGIAITTDPFFTANQATDKTVTFTLSTDTASTANTLVYRDESGDFSANLITANLDGVASEASKLENARTITLTGDVAGNFSFDGSSDVTFNTSIQANSVQLGTDTTGNYLLSVSAGSGIAVSGTEGEGWTATVAHADTSTQETVTNTDGNVIQSITVDGFGHVTALSSVDLDARFVNVTGDTISGNLIVTGNLTVSGTTTTVDSTVTTIKDPVITIGESDTVEAFDRGIEYKYSPIEGTQKLGFFGLDRSSGYFTFIPDATISTVEVDETFTIQLRTESTSGTVVATSNVITVQAIDLSLTSTTTVVNTSQISARYWRIKDIVIPGGGYLEISELEFLTDGVKNNSNKTYSSSEAPSTNTLNDIFDGNTSTRNYWSESTVENPSFWIKVSYDEPQIINGIRQAGYDNSSRYIAGFTVEFSLDDINWTSLKTFSNLPYPGNQVFSEPYEFNDPVLGSPSFLIQNTNNAFTVTTTNITDGTTLYWSINHGTTDATDFNSTSGSFVINSNTGTFDVVPTVSTTGVFSGTLGDFQATNFRGALVGNADTASKWAQTMTLTLDGNVSGTVSFDGSAATTMTTTVDVVDGGTY